MCVGVRMLSYTSCCTCMSPSDSAPCDIMDTFHSFPVTMAMLSRNWLTSCQQVSPHLCWVVGMKSSWLQDIPVLIQNAWSTSCVKNIVCMSWVPASVAPHSFWAFPCFSGSQTVGAQIESLIKSIYYCQECFFVPTTINTLVLMLRPLTFVYSDESPIVLDTPVKVMSCPLLLRSKKQLWKCQAAIRESHIAIAFTIGPQPQGSHSSDSSLLWFNLRFNKPATTQQSHASLPQLCFVNMTSSA